MEKRPEPSSRVTREEIAERLDGILITSTALTVQGLRVVMRDDLVNLVVTITKEAAERGAPT